MRLTGPQWTAVYPVQQVRISLPGIPADELESIGPGNDDNPRHCSPFPAGILVTVWLDLVPFSPLDFLCKDDGPTFLRERVAFPSDACCT